ncbi:FliA/WhiG family RNA polymerase sigma factor [Bacillus chungangensis]|uniref:RNA polymerase sigma factor for flagellar operon FliA n=1 Tax=Bacillus chungangensis TaxID=587633 RepID=A0ABT9WRG0_9BACI|nr:FliA/WhiG family RNA polymerase sigma factor [Bacillus chungangensis]MDQ0175797.1 RNA polymerase sigma factor for flagellar operon FliA [Bacillus chungangensis]
MANQTLTEEQKQWQSWTDSRDTEAGNALVKRYMPLVHYHVQRIAVGLPRNVSIEDLKSLGMIGLFDALNKFDTSRDLKFDTYASFRIRGAIIDGLRKEDWLPRGTREKAKKIEAVIEKLEQEKQRHVAAEEVAKELAIPEEEVYRTLHEHFTASILSIDEHFQDNEDGETRKVVLRDDHTPCPEEHLLKDETIEELTKLIAELSKQEQIVLSLFYFEELTLTEIGEILHLSTSRISQIHSKALFRLRKALQPNA